MMYKVRCVCVSYVSGEMCGERESRVLRTEEEEAIEGAGRKYEMKCVL